MKAPIRVAIITNIVPAYRGDYFRRIFADSALKVTIFCQNRIPGMNLPSIHAEFGERVMEITYQGLDREKFGWQYLPIKHLLQNFDIYFIYGNPRIISNVAFSLLLRAQGKTVVVEGQLHTGGSFKAFKTIRLAWWRLFKFIYLYNDNEVRQLQQMAGFSNKVMVGMNNGLNQEAINAAIAIWSPPKLLSWRQEQQLQDHLLILSCARLEPKNQFQNMIECLPELLDRFPSLIWCVIGGGQEAKSLESKAIELGVNSAIRWLGPLYDEAQLAPWFLSAKVLVHPGSVGLSLLHAFGYGVPVITHNNAHHHMPEFAALQPGINGEIYTYGDKKSMTSKISELLNNPTRLGLNARLTAENRFNTRIMAERFHKICLLAASHTRNQACE